MYGNLVDNTNIDIVLRRGNSSTTGILRLADGTAAAPTYSFASATNLGIFKSAANTIGVAVTGLDVMDFSINAFSAPVISAASTDFYLKLPSGHELIVGDSGSNIISSSIWTSSGISGFASWYWRYGVNLNVSNQFRVDYGNQYMCWGVGNAAGRRILYVENGNASQNSQYGMAVADNQILATFSSFGNSNFTANPATDVCTVTTNPPAVRTATAIVFTTTGTLPAGLSLATTYFAINVTRTTFKVATTVANALAGTAIDITDAGTGVHTLAPTLDFGEVVNSSYTGIRAGIADNATFDSSTFSLQTDRPTYNFTVSAVNAFSGASGTNRNGGNLVLQAGSAAAGGNPGSIQAASGFGVLAGSAAGPGFGFTADPSTGIYRSAASTIGFTAGGTSLGTWTTGALALATTSITGIGSALTGTMSTALTLSIPNTTSGAGVDISITASSAGGAGPSAGGNINLRPGTGVGAGGAPGLVNIKDNAGNTMFNFGTSQAGTDASIFIAPAMSYLTFGLAGIAATPSFRIIPVASAVNFVQVSGAVTGSGALLAATGTDSNVAMLISGKGNAGVQLNASRLMTARAADVASANNMTLGNTGNVFLITGNTQMNLLDATGWVSGSIVTLVFTTGTPLIKFNQAFSTTFKPYVLATGIDFSIAKNPTVLTLCYDAAGNGGNGQWVEVSRSANAA